MKHPFSGKMDISCPKSFRPHKKSKKKVELSQLKKTDYKMIKRMTNKLQKIEAEKIVS